MDCVSFKSLASLETPPLALCESQTEQVSITRYLSVRGLSD